MFRRHRLTPVMVAGWLATTITLAMSRPRWPTVRCGDWGETGCDNTPLHTSCVLSFPCVCSQHTLHALHVC